MSSLYQLGVFSSSSTRNKCETPHQLGIFQRAWKENLFFIRIQIFKHIKSSSVCFFLFSIVSAFLVELPENSIMSTIICSRWWYSIRCKGFHWCSFKSFTRSSVFSSLNSDDPVFDRIVMILAHSFEYLFQQFLKSSMLLFLIDFQIFLKGMLRSINGQLIRDRMIGW